MSAFSVKLEGAFAAHPRKVRAAGEWIGGGGSTGPHGTPLLDDFERDNGPLGANWTTVDNNTESVIVDGEFTADPEDENCAAQWTTSYAVPCEVWATLGPGDYEASIYFDLLAAAGTEGGDATFEPYVNNDGDSSLWAFPGIGDSNGDSYPINDAPGPALAENDGIGFSYDGFTATAYHRAGADGEWSVVATGDDDSALGAEGFLNLWNYGEGAASFKGFGGGSYTP